MKIAKETWIIALIGAADLITTILFIRRHGAEEANPLFRQYWEMGMPSFIIAKIVMMACPLAILEWARRRIPRFVAIALKTTIVGYVCLYGIGFFRLNGFDANADDRVRQLAEAESGLIESGDVDALFQSPETGEPHHAPLVVPFDKTVAQ